MKPYDWNELKNVRLKSERLITFEDILTAIDEGKLLDKIERPNKKRYGHQQVLVINVDDYVYLVPFVEDEQKILFLTIIPSRKATKKYLRGEQL